MTAMDRVQNKSQTGNYDSDSVIMHYKYPERERVQKCWRDEAHRYRSGTLRVALGFYGEQRVHAGQ
jgi:hypothetical protein